MEIVFSKKFVTLGLVVMVLVALGLSIVSFVVSAEFYTLFLSQMIPPEVLGFNLEDGIGVRFLNVDREGTIATWYSSSVLLLCSVVLAAIASAVKRAGERYVRHWAALSIIFALLSVDEASAIHEMTIEPLRSLLDAGGLFHFTWVVLGGAFVIVFALAYLRFLFSLPTKSRLLFIAAGVLYVLGALGLEMLDGFWADLHSESNLTYTALVTVEEFLEMTGASLFLYALIQHKGHLEQIHRNLEKPTEEAVADARQENFEVPERQARSTAS